MLVKQLLGHFDKYESLHIDVNDLRDQLIERGIQDEIKFHFVNMETSKIRGILHRYTRSPRPYAEPVLCSDIIISEDMGDENEAWQRLVAVKELLHISDCERLSAESQEAVDHIFEKFALPPELRLPTDKKGAVKSSYLNDEVTIYFALAVLVPKRFREKFRPLYGSKLSDREIAEIAKIPSRYVPHIMQHRFEDDIEAFLSWAETFG